MSAFRVLGEERASAVRGRLRLPAGEGTARDNGAVRLRPDWPALFAMTAYARRATWLFGNRDCVLEWIERRPGVRPVCRGDRTSMRFNLLRWQTAFARREDAARHLDFFSAGGSAIATVRLDDCDRAVDELIWLLMDDTTTAAARPDSRERIDDITAARSALPFVEYRDDFDRLVNAYRLRRTDAFALAGPRVATPLPAGSVERALLAAADARLPIRVHLDNGGGTVTWRPATRFVADRADHVELSSGYGRLHVARTIGRTWLVHLAGTDSAGPSLEAESADGGCIRIDVSEDENRRLHWRDVCLELAKDGLHA